MRHSVPVCALLVVTAAALAGQTAQQGPYSGHSSPPPDTTIIDNTPLPQPEAPAKPSPSHPMAQPMLAPAQPQGRPMPQAMPVATRVNYSDGTDDGMVQVAPGNSQPTLNQRLAVSDPDGDIVHPAPPPPGVLVAGTEIRARLLEQLSTARNQSGDSFRCRVSADVSSDHQILIPAGAEIDGTIVQVSTGHLAGHGSMLLRPETVILPDGTHIHLYAQTSGAPDSNARVSGEGSISPGSRVRKDEIEYGAAVGVGAITGGIVGGPPGLLAGTLIGAGAVTVHLMVNHPQATLRPGAVLLFSLTEPLNLATVAPAAGQPMPPASAQPDPVAPSADPQPTADAQPLGDRESATVTQN